jgi:hypothetical protein
MKILNTVSFVLANIKNWMPLEYKFRCASLIYLVKMLKFFKSLNHL